MYFLEKLWRRWKKYSVNLSRWVTIPGICYLELLFHKWIGGDFSPEILFTLLGFSLCLGGLLNIPAAFLPRKISRWYVGIVLFLYTTITMVELLIGDAYINFMRPALIFVSAGGVLTDFTDIMIDMIIQNLPRIAIALIPFWLLLLSGKTRAFHRTRCAIASLAIAAVGGCLGLFSLDASAGGLDQVIPMYDFNNSMKRNGITVSIFMELSGLAGNANGLGGGEFTFDFQPEYPDPAATELTTLPEAPTVTEAPEETVPSTEAAAQTDAPEETELQAITEPTDKTKTATEPTDKTKTATEPTEKTEAATEPTEETEAATEPTKETEATTEPTEETEAVTEPTKETESTTEPTEETEATTEPTEETEAETEPETQPKEEPRVYKPHVIPGLDFGELAEIDNDPTRRNLFSYLDTLTPAMENEYTGLFEGKNLILITAEAFNYAIIDPELTPTLYRLSTQGIQFTNAYVPLWTGNTSGGELVAFSGLAMNCEMYAYSRQQPFNTISRHLMNRGYFTRAYHDNGYYFYDRNKTHEDLGYEKYIGMGNGLEKGVTDVWPASDLEMIDFTVPQYIDQQPFSIYYMTCSAHCRYNFLGNAQCKKNRDLVADLPYSEGLKAYIACNLELEKALTSLVAQLEEAGIADDTVIVMVSDHFPYGLGTAWGNDHDCLAELYGVTKYDEIDRDRNTLIIWSGSLEGKGIRIDAPVSSVDILPTLSNLFGVEYDSRLSIGRDVFGTEEAIVPWPDFSWVTELGKFDSSTRTFTPFVEESQIPEGYVDRISSTVRTRISFSRSVQTCGFFSAIQSYLENQES